MASFNQLLQLLAIILITSNNVSFISCGLPPGNRHPNPKAKLDQLEPITKEELMSGIFNPVPFLGDWAPGSDNLIRYWTADSIRDYNVENGEEEVVLHLKNITDHLPPDSPLAGVTFSNDGRYALIQHGKTITLRLVADAKYDILDMSTGQFSQLAPPDSNDIILQYATWSPTGLGITFVHNYNIYHKSDPSPGAPIRKLTTDGREGSAPTPVIYNGVPDLIYEGMLFRDSSLWVSNSGDNLAFIKLDETEVGEMVWPMYGEVGSEDSIYPKYRKRRHPRPGTPNPIAEVYIVSLTVPNSEPIKASFPETAEVDRHIIGAVLWASENELMVATMHRNQNVSHWHLCPADTAVCRQIYTYQLDHGWIDISVPKVSSSGQEFIFVRSVKQEDPDPESFKHIVMFMANKTSKTLSSGRLSVDNILGWDETSHKIYFSGTFWNGSHEDPGEAHVYYVPDDGANTIPTCITCTLRNSFNSPCRYNAASIFDNKPVSFSANFTRFIHNCNGPDVPETTTRYTYDGHPVENPGPTYNNNTAIRQVLANKAVPIRRDFTHPIAGGNFTARIRLLLPSDFDESRKYPLVIYQYGGPHSLQVTQMFRVGWEETLVSGKGVIVGFIDGRGTGFSSTDHLFALHRQLGTVEIEDCLTVTKHLTETLPFIDADNTAIFGWSYGGFATIKVLETDTDNVFKCGIAGCPVTNWRYYESFYTERFMGLATADDNLQAYQDSDTTSPENVENLRNKQFMLAHGTADDNVHYQNAMILARSLEQADIFFHQLSYPDQDHGFYAYGESQPHVLHSLERFLFEECFQTRPTR